MLVAGQWDGTDGLPTAVPSKSMGVNRKKDKLSESERWSIRRRGAWVLHQQGFTYTEIAVVMGIEFEAVHSLLGRMRRLRDEVLADAS